MNNEGIDGEIVYFENIVGWGHNTEGVRVEVIKRDLKKIDHLYVERRDRESQNTAELV